MIKNIKMKQKKNKTDSIIKAISYGFAVIVVIYTVKNGTKSNYQNLFAEIGKIGSIVAVILVIIAAILGISKLIKYIKHKNSDIEDNPDIDN